jgi:hypothetical protein
MMVDTPRETPAQEASPTPDPFDPASLAINGNPSEAIGAKRTLVTVPVRKPNRQEFFRVNPEESHALQMAVLELKSEREIYAVVPEIAMALPGETRIVTLTTTINRQGNLFLWPVPLPSDDGRQLAWHTSAREAAALARDKWVRMVANMGGGYYDIWEAEGTIADPRWPENTFQQLLKIAFGGGRLIESEDHPVLNQLLGRE